MNNRIIGGQLARLNDVDVSTGLAKGVALVYDDVAKKWVPGSTSASSIGTPSDGSWKDGINAWSEGTKVSDAFDDVNEILAELAPANALPLDGVSLTSGTKYTGKLPTGLNLNWYADGKVAGDTVTDLVLTTTGTYSTPNTTTTFNYADEGLLKLYINDVLKATIDLKANFVEANRKTSQVVSDYNTQGDGDVISGGIVTFTGGTFQILSVERYNGFSKWQKGTARVSLSVQLSEGYNNVYLVHELPSGNQSTTKLSLRYDNDTNAPAFVGTPAVTEGTVVGKHLSGVKYYTLGDTFNVGYTVDHAFKKAYHSTQVSNYSMPGVANVVKNPSSVPATSDQLVVSDSAVGITLSNIMTNNARLTATARDPYGNAPTAQSPAEGRLVLTYPNRSTDKQEFFTDEVYRLPNSFDFNSQTAAVTGVWDSTSPLTNGYAQCYLSGTTPALVFPTGNFSVGFVPAQSANYSAFSGNQQYARAFVATSAQSGVTITLGGLTAGLAQLGSGDVNVEIKLPGMTGWGDAMKAYDSTADKSVDGFGMLVGSVTYSGGNATLTATFGGASTVNSGNRIYVRVTLRNGTRFITSMSVGW